MALLTEAQTKEIVNGAIEKIKESVVNEATNQAIWTTKDEIGKSIRDIVSTFVKEEIAPGILLELNKNKSLIIEAAVVSAQSLAETLAKGMADSLAENLGTSYKRDRILKSLFE